jgi:CBS domain-containing protein
VATETRVRDVMTETVVTTRADTRLEEAARLLREHHISGLPVVDRSEHVVGVLSERDIVRQLHRATGIGSPRGLLDLLLESSPTKGESILVVSRRQLRNARVSDAMSSKVVTVPRGASVEDAARALRRHGVKRLPVVDAQGCLVGIVTRADILRAVSGELRARRGALHPGPSGRRARGGGPFEDV